MKSLNKLAMGGLCLSSALALSACVSDGDSDSNETSSSSVVVSASSTMSDAIDTEVTSSSSEISSSAISSSSEAAPLSSSEAASSSSSKTAKSSSSVAAIPLADFDSLFLAETNGIDCAEGDTLASEYDGVTYRCQKDSTGNVGWQRPYLDYTATPCADMKTWVAEDDGSRIETGCNTGLENSGYWFEYSDSEDGGASYITWPVAKGEGIDPLGAIIDSGYALTGTYTLARGTLTYNPYVGVGFWLGGTDSNGTPALVDASSWEPVCITYSSDIAASLEMDLGHYMNATIGFDNPYVSLTKTGTGIVTKTFTWDKFKQAGWGAKKILGEQAAKMLAGFKFMIQGANGSTGSFTIYSIGIDGCYSGLAL